MFTPTTHPCTTRARPFIHPSVHPRLLRFDVRSTPTLLSNLIKKNLIIQTYRRISSLSPRIMDGLLSSSLSFSVQHVPFLSTHAHARFSNSIHSPILALFFDGIRIYHCDEFGLVREECGSVFGCNVSG